MSSIGEGDPATKNLITWENDASPTEFTAEHLEEMFRPIQIKRDLYGSWGDGFVGFMGSEEERQPGNWFTSIHVYQTVSNPATRNRSQKTLPTAEIGYGRWWQPPRGIILPSKPADRLRVERVEVIQFVDAREGDEELSEGLLLKGTSGADEVTLYVRKKDGEVIYSREPAHRDEAIPDAMEEVERLRGL